MALSAEYLAAAEALVRRLTGLVFGEARRSTLAAGLAAALRRARTHDPDLYLARLTTDPTLLDDLVAEITVSETYFFRDPLQFAVIREKILPALLSGRSHHRPLRVWSAGCASGEEAYSLAILLRILGPDGDAHILGTDLARAALARARRGCYTRWSFRGVSDHMMGTYFTPVDGHFELASAVRASVEFRYLNLAEDTYPSLTSSVWGMDLILCRNVLIYFDPDTIARVARRLIDSLSQDGWLVLGASDPCLAGLVPCDVVVTDGGLAYRRSGVAGVTVAALTPPSGSEFADEEQSADTPASNAPALLVGAPPCASAEAAEDNDGASDDNNGASNDAEAAIRCYAAREYARAIALADRAVRRDGSKVTAWTVLVRALANRGDREAAERSCLAALERHGDVAELAYLQAVLLSEAERYAEAATAARRALYLDRTLAVAHLALGDALARLGLVEGARRAFGNAERQLISLAPGAIVPASDGESAGRLASMTQMQLKLLAPPAA